MSTCQVCKCSFSPSGRNQKYCSPSCVKENRRKRKSEFYYKYYRAPIRQIKCQICESYFFASGAARKYCSKTCADVAKKAYQDVWNKSDAGKRSRARHIARWRESARLWRAANADVISEKKALYRARNRDVISEKQALDYARNREKRLAQANARRAADPEKFRERDRNRRRRARAAELALREMGLI